MARPDVTQQLEEAPMAVQIPWSMLLASILALLFNQPRTPAAGPPPLQRTPLLLDTHFGSSIDDAYALALALASPEIDLQGITTVGKDAEDRAWMICRFLTAVERRTIPVAWGRGKQTGLPIADFIQYRRHPAVIFNRTSRPVKTAAVDFLYARLKGNPGKFTLLVLGPLTNIAQLLRQHPDCKPLIKRIVLSRKAGNIKADIPAAQTVFSSGVPLLVASSDPKALPKLNRPLQHKIFAACTPLTFQLQALHQLSLESTTALFDPLAVGLCIDQKYCKVEARRLQIDDKGVLRPRKGKPNARMAMAYQGEKFHPWFIGRLTAGKSVLPRAPGNLAAVIPREKMPHRVHCFEDFETDIEKRWWMSGKLEIANVPSGSRRACRGVLTQDFDDLQGDIKTMYTAVIFNPVPGPPMGKNTRLSFRYWLKGTDTLRIQIYSLTNGYHRYLSLRNLPEEKWRSATVDMTAVRRPDGTGGPLSENERIDDIQFYVDPRAELIIDDIVLFDAAAAGEKRPFPKSIQFTAGFDTGRQGKEWPGTFDIVEKKGFFWKAALAVPNRRLDAPWIRLHLRGPRPLGKTTHLSFRYNLKGADHLKLRLIQPAKKGFIEVELKNLKAGRWAEAVAAFPPGDKPIRLAEEIHFLPPKGSVLLVDDVLLYEPGNK
jgi:inosine-uridine nucleoside N-ribohydrolase